VKIQPQWVVTPGKQTNKQQLIYISNLILFPVSKPGLFTYLGQMLQQEGINTAHKWRRGEENCHEVLDHHIQLITKFS
jgi:hypothetical protein